MYALLILTKSGVVSDTIWYYTLLDAQEDMKFYKSFYGTDYKYKIVSEKQYSNYNYR